MHCAELEAAKLLVPATETWARVNRTDFIADPTLLCNELGVAPTATDYRRRTPPMVSSCGRAATSIKEAVRIAQSNSFMGLICTSRLLELVPALVSSIKEAGLVLISDYSHDLMLTNPGLLDLPQGADGLLMDNAVLRFKEAVEQ